MTSVSVSRRPCRTLRWRAVGVIRYVRPEAPPERADDRGLVLRSEPSRDRDPADVLIVGGGVVGCFVAFFLAMRAPELRVTVVEPDPSYRTASTPRAASAIRTQFNLGINVAMSLFGWEFYARAEEHLSVDGSPIDIGLTDCPYLVLSGADGTDRMRAAAAVQNGRGAAVDLLDVDALTTRVPWLRTDGIGAATLGLRSEGWIDPVVTLHLLRAKVASMGVEFVQGAVAVLERSGDRIVRAVLDDGTTISPGTVVNAAGAKAARVAATAGVEIPVESRKRTAFVFSVARPVAGFTNLVDPTFGSRGVYARPFGEDYLAVTSPDVVDDLDTDDLEPDLHLFEEVVRPALSRRVRGFEHMTLQRAWAGHYEITTLDQNALIGSDAGCSNLVMACGFSGHGVMHAPAAGRGVAELILDGGYSSLDLSPFTVGRVADGRPLDDVQASEHRRSSAGV